MKIYFFSCNIRKIFLSLQRIPIDIFISIKLDSGKILCRFDIFTISYCILYLFSSATFLIFKSLNFFSIEAFFYLFFG